MPLRFACLALVLAVAAGCSGDASSPPESTLSPAAPAVLAAKVDLALVPGFTLNSCTGASAETLNRGRCDPVNLAFPGSSFADVTAALVGAGWSLVGLGTPESVLPPGSQELLLQVVQLFKTDGAGLTSPRFHIRLWQLPGGLTIGAVHHESGGLDHGIDRAWEDAEAEVRRALCTAAVVCSQSEVLAEQLRLQNGMERWRGFRNDGRLTVIRLTGPR